MIYIGVVCLMAGCTITGRLNRKGYAPTMEHSTKQLREYVEEKKEEHRRGYIEYTHEDGTKDYLVPTTTGADGETMMTLNIDAVTVVAQSRSLPERMGKVNIDFVVTLPRELQGNCQSVEVIPTLHLAAGGQELEALTIRGGLFSKVQQRNYWQLDRYRERFSPDEEHDRWAENRFIYYPYPQGARLDSIMEGRNTISYFYTQEVPTQEAGNRLLITLEGRVIALDRSYYHINLSDTLEYNISSMLSFTDTTTRYMTKVIEKYAVVNDRNYLNFRVNRSDIIDTLGGNRDQLARIENLMDEIINQKEFHVDSIILTASASPEGSVAKNDRLARDRANSLRSRLIGKFGSKGIDEKFKVRWIGEDWAELERLVRSDGNLKNRAKILAMIENRGDDDLDRLEKEIKRLYPQDYRYMLEELYPRLRAVSFKYDLRRVGMVKDTIHTTVPDTLYAQGVQMMQDRKYAQALEVLGGFNDRNTAICMLSLGLDQRAYQVLVNLQESATNFYLTAIACARLARREESLEWFDKACALNENLKYRGKLDPEISELIKDRDSHP